MAIKRTYVFKNGKIVEVTPLKNRHKLYPTDKAFMDNRDAVMCIGEGESKHIADENLSKMIKSGEFDKMYSPDKRD